MGDTTTAAPPVPWKVTSTVKGRIGFVEASLSDEHTSMTELCREFGISRKTGYGPA